MAPRYSPEGVAQRWQEAWEAKASTTPSRDRRRPSLSLPPPNVTGRCTWATRSARRSRTRRSAGTGCAVSARSRQPGYDHAGIATQNVVEKELAKEGLSRHDVGRDAFLERTWAWLEHYGGVIMGQLRSLGASLDYRRERFTMDDGYQRAVLLFFVRLHERGFLYRDHRIGNWCPRCLSAISDLEVNHIERRDTLSTVRYAFADGEGGIEVATVRTPILADVAVAVHPEDERYRAAIGRG
jgi:valyl-tRNA synthetase